MNPRDTLTVLLPKGGESLSSFLKRITATTGAILVVLAPLEEGILGDDKAQKKLFDVCVGEKGRLHLAIRSQRLAKRARALGLRTIDRIQDLQKFLKDHPDADESLREFQPYLWQKQLRSRLQAMGLLSLPKLRVWSLIALSALLFLFVLFRLLPSATVSVQPRENTISQTANIFLVQSGAIVDLPPRVRTMELVPITVRVDRTLTYDQISLEFIGENAQVVMTIINNSSEPYWLKKGTRLSNQAGIIFRLQESLQIAPQSREAMLAKADPLDLYGVVVGDRGNVPQGLKWDFLGLTREERIHIYAENSAPGTGGMTDYRTLLHEDDLNLAKVQLEQELLAEAKQLVDEQVELLNTEHAHQLLELLYYEELTQLSYRDFELPKQFIGEPVKSIPVSGSIEYTAYAYDTQYVLDLLSDGLLSHVGEGERLREDSLDLERLVAHVIDYEDDLLWIKLTVDLSGTQEYILDPLSPTGALFAKKVRQNVAGMHREDAERIVSNYPEVEKAEVSVWPPWQTHLPDIPAHIVVQPIEKD